LREKVSGKCTTNTSVEGSRDVMTMIRMCTRCQIDSGYVRRLNWVDLQASIIERQIEDTLENLEAKKQHEYTRRGFHGVKEISGEEVTQFLGGRKKHGRN